ncbi:MAG: spore germination protein [Paenibacillaceae bacterium]|nr:spore germination protein [Paenibacillaceae bacterium]
MEKKQNQAPPAPAGKSSQPLERSLDANLQLLKSQLAQSSDISIRVFENPSSPPVRMALIYVEGLVDNTQVAQDVLRPLLKPGFGLDPDREQEDAGPSSDGMISLLADKVLTVVSLRKASTVEKVFEHLFNGYSVILVEGCNTAIGADTSGGEKRNIEEPTTQTVIRGPKESFNESLKTNLSLIRRRIKSPKLASTVMQIGTVTQTDVAVVHIEGIAQDGIVQEVMKRLEAIDTDSILEGGYIEDYIQDSTFSPFPTLLNTERPDACIAGLLEGKVAIVVDGTPFVLLAPVTFPRYFQSSEDYYQRADIASFLRIIRFMSFFLSLLLPALYISITTFHQEMLPTPLLISLASQREGVPFPAFIEAIMMELTFEVLREAGVRMPRAIGPAISIVGALVLGQAAVQAGLISAAMVIVVSFTAISNFVVPYISLSISARLIRFAMMIFAGCFGLFGVMSGLMILLIHLSGLRSFGVPYLDPLSPLQLSAMKDVFIRFPRWSMYSRPRSVANPGNLKRQKRGQEPLPPGKKGTEGEQS